MNDTTTTQTAEILFERRGQLGLITMNRPKALNALTHEMSLALDRALKAWAGDAKIATVAIIGAGPAGLFLARLLQLQGIDSVVLESRDRAYVERRVRAGILEQGTVDTLREIGVGERMGREGLVHGGTQLRFDGTNHHIDFEALTGRKVMVYGQQEVVKDLIAKGVKL